MDFVFNSRYEMKFMRINCSILNFYSKVRLNQHNIYMNWFNINIMFDTRKDPKKCVKNTINLTQNDFPVITRIYVRKFDAKFALKIVDINSELTLTQNFLLYMYSCIRLSVSISHMSLMNGGCHCPGDSEFLWEFSLAQLPRDFGYATVHIPWCVPHREHYLYGSRLARSNIGTTPRHSPEFMNFSWPRAWSRYVSSVKYKRVFFFNFIFFISRSLSSFSWAFLLYICTRIRWIVETISWLLTRSWSWSGIRVHFN